MLDHVKKHQDDINKSIQNSIGGEPLSQEELEKSTTDFFEKGASKNPIGAIKTFGGREYVKTAAGWKYHGKGTGAKAQEHAKASGAHNSGAGHRNPADDTSKTPAERDAAREKKLKDGGAK